MKAKNSKLGVLERISDKYVNEKNPEAIQKLGVDAKALNEILLSKLPELIQQTKGPL